MHCEKHSILRVKPEVTTYSDAEVAPISALNDSTLNITPPPRKTNNQYTSIKQHNPKRIKKKDNNHITKDKNEKKNLKTNVRFFLFFLFFEYN